MTEKIDASINDVFKTTPVGSVDGAIGNAFYGINHRQTQSPVPINQDTFGLTFFTRPQLNLVSENIRAERRFIPLLTNNSASIPRIIRAYLDPRLNNDGLNCPFVDPKNPFIPILTNHLISMSGWPDVTAETFTSKPGAYKEVYSMVDGTSRIYGAYNITASFRNMIGDPITTLFDTWTSYQNNVMEGTMVPYPDLLVANEIDYNTRIWRLVLDKTKTFVQKIAACGAAFPISVPMAKAFDFQTDKPLNETNNEIQVQFQCIGATYNDPILVYEFNKLAGIFNPDMRNGKRPANMQKVPFSALQIFNGTGYSRIDPDTMELEWYVPKIDYVRVMEAYVKQLDAVGIEMGE